MTDLLAPPRPAPVVRTSIGKKQVMAVTGLLLIGFVVAHMLGNLKFFTGASHFDEYAEFIRRIGDPVLGHAWALWLMRAGLLTAVSLHIWAAVSLTRQSRAARPVGYAHSRAVQANYASRTMRWGGVILFLFIVYHLLHMTTGTVHPEFHHGRVYDNTVVAFQVWYVTLAYVVAMGALCLHLYHGVWSMLQTLGRNNPRVDAGVRAMSKGLAVVVFLGFVSVPLAVLFGYGS